MDTSDRATVRRAVVAVTIVSFSLAALMGIAALLSVTSFGDTEIRILLTTVVVGCASVLSLACLVPLETRWSAVAVAGFLVTLATAALALTMVWAESDLFSDDVAKALGVGITASVTLAQICLLLGVSVHRPSIWPLVATTIAVATVLAGLVIALVVGWDASDAGGRVIGIVAILDVLGTVVTLALGVFGGRADPALTVTVSPDLAARMRQQAEQTGRPVGQLVDEALERYLRTTGS